VERKLLKRRTIQHEVSASGLGVVTGQEVTVTLRPAPSGYGIRFQRPAVGLELLVHPDHLLEVGNCTAFSDGTHRVFVAEHLLSVCHGFHLTDLAVVLSHEELPLFDGSAGPLARLVQEAGLRELEETIAPLVVTRPLRISRTEQGREKTLEIRPYEGFKVTYRLEHPHPLIGTDEAEYVEGVHDYATELAPARTFVTVAEVEAVRAQGLLTHGAEDNALVIYDDHYSAPLRLEHEFARHKILDLLGDLYLLGRPLRGEVVARRTGHTDNRVLVRRWLAASGTGEGRVED